MGRSRVGGTGGPDPWKITSYYRFPKKAWYGPPREAIRRDCFSIKVCMTLCGIR